MAVLANQQSGAQSVAKRLTKRLDTAPLDRHLWGVAVLDPGGKLIFGRNADRLFIPASNTKLVVAGTAAVLLPSDFKVRTSVYALGVLEGAVLRGDLVLYGRGDPTMSRRCFAVDTTAARSCEADPTRPFAALAAALATRGIHAVDGDIIGDGSYFEPKTVQGSWENDDLIWWYAAPVSGLGFNDNSVDLTIQPAATIGAPAIIDVWPRVGDLAFENRTETVGPDGRTELRYSRAEGTWHFMVGGTVRIGSKPDAAHIALPDPNLYAALMFRRSLDQAGIEVRGSTRSTTDSMATQEARNGMPLAEVDSRPLGDWIFPILNSSQNWYAEMLLKQLGRTFGTSGSWQEGLRVERRFLIDSVKADSTQFLIRDGSGLSAQNLVSPLTFAKLLQFVRGHPHYPVFAAGLPQSGVTGSLKNRFVKTPLEGRIRAKTGSISEVNTLSGYLENAGDSTDVLPGHGPLRIFSIQANHHMLGGRSMIQAIDSVVVEMGRDVGKKDGRTVRRKTVRR